MTYAELIQQGRSPASITLDLGCGTTKRGDLGIDCAPLPGVDYVCELGFHPIPLPDQSVGRVFAHDFLEHLPAVVWLAPARALEDGRGVVLDTQLAILYPRIRLLREVYRVLVPGCFFESSTPSYDHLAPALEWAQDPTHAAPPWTANTWQYFCGAFPHVTQAYGIDFAFECVTMERRPPSHLYVVLRRPW